MYSYLADGGQRFNGKEIQTVGSSSLRFLDYGARMYDPTTMRWLTQDPMAEKYYGYSPYNCCVGNPVNVIDTDGEAIILIILAKGAIGAVVDVAAQVTVAMLYGKDFKHAMASIDYTSVGTSFVTSMLSVPGLSISPKIAKAVSAGMLLMDAAVDIDSNEGFESVLSKYKHKSGFSFVLELATAELPNEVVDRFTSEYAKSLEMQLDRRVAATMTNEEKKYLKNTRSVLNSDGVQAGVKNVASYFWGLIENSGKKVFDADDSNTTKNKTSCTPQISSSMERSDEESNLRQPYFK